MLFLFSNKLVKNRKDKEALLIYSAYKSTIEYIKRYSIFLLSISPLKVVELALSLKVVRLVSLSKIVRLISLSKIVRFASSPKVVELVSSKIKTKV